MTQKDDHHDSLYVGTHCIESLSKEDKKKTDHNATPGPLSLRDYSFILKLLKNILWVIYFRNKVKNYSFFLSGLNS